ncbi:RNA polymerase sigma factor [Euzebya sp.]|uniref:RNA polymerase sigma factor n=1 Tax=Euzebya sp. TaxID=1971409 RepID=UPI00351565CB
MTPINAHDGCTPDDKTRHVVGVLLSPHSGVAGLAVAGPDSNRIRDDGADPAHRPSRCASPPGGAEMARTVIDPFVEHVLAVPAERCGTDAGETMVVGTSFSGACSEPDTRHRGTAEEPAVGRSTTQPDVGAHETLAVRARAGDRAALVELLELIDGDGSIRVPVRRLVTNPQAVEDISQDVLILVAERIGSWDGRSRFTTWLYTVARNKAIDHLRTLRPTEGLPEDVVSDQRRISSLIATREAVTGLLADLPEAYREPVTLRDVEQLEYAEIARLLDLHQATVRTRVKRGRAMIAAAWVRTAA